MKKTVMLISETCQDGVGRHVSDLVKGLNHENYNIIVVHGTERVDYYFKNMQRAMSDKVIFVPVPSMCRNIHPIRDIKALIHVGQIIRRYRPSIVHCHSSKAGVLGRLIAPSKSYVEKVIYTPHAYAIQNNQLGMIKHTFYKIIEKWLGHRKKTFTINVSNGEWEFARKHKLTGEASDVVYNALEDLPKVKQEALDKLRQSLGIVEGKKVVICVARLYHQKDPHMFFEIAKAILGGRQDVQFIWVGEGELLNVMRERVRKEIRSNDEIQFIGHSQNIHPLLSMADVFLSTSLYEGLPYTLIEACRSGLPVVATAIVGNSEVITEGDNGMFFDLGDIKGAERSLATVLDNVELRSTMTKNAREVYEQGFKMESMIQAVERIYERISL